MLLKCCLSVRRVGPKWFASFHVISRAVVLRARVRQGASALQLDEEGAQELADARDGWDFDCNFSLPDAPDSAATSAAPQGDQGWVGFGPSPDASSASHMPQGVKGGPPAQDGLPPHNLSSVGQHGLKDHQPPKVRHFMMVPSRHPAMYAQPHAWVTVAGTSYNIYDAAPHNLLTPSTISGRLIDPTGHACAGQGSKSCKQQQRRRGAGCRSPFQTQHHSRQHVGGHRSDTRGCRPGDHPLAGLCLKPFRPYAGVRLPRRRL